MWNVWGHSTVSIDYHHFGNMLQSRELNGEATLGLSCWSIAQSPHPGGISLTGCVEKLPWLSSCQINTPCITQAKFACKHPILRCCSKRHVFARSNLPRLGLLVLHGKSGHPLRRPGKEKFKCLKDPSKDLPRLKIKIKHRVDPKIDL